ncbi:MAG: hypothetical protein RR539_00200 [Clostridium sp.]|uniref:hypothetical protein n=1 Tax=Clostridium sp. TaxID=1506 RepID=UPI002FCAFF5A
MKNANIFSINSLFGGYSGEKKEKNNMIMSTLIGNFQKKFGLKSQGVDIISNIINNLSEDTECIVERNILVFNLYNLIDEYIDLERYDLAYSLIEKAKRCFSRDVILGDSLGSFHVSWIEQIMLKEAKLNMKIKENQRAEEICRNVIDMREQVRCSAAFIDENIDTDLCLAISYRYLSKINIHKNNSLGADYIKKSIYYKCINKDDYKAYIKRYSDINNEKDQEAYSFLVKTYLNELPPSYDNIKYGYCETCSYNCNNYCQKHNIKVSCKKACAQYMSNCEKIINKTYN